MSGYSRGFPLDIFREAVIIKTGTLFGKEVRTTKKALMIIALVCLIASSAFAVSITDWETWFSNNPIREYVSDLNPAGFVVDIPLTANAMGSVDIVSNNVADWIFDENASVPVKITGFDNMRMIYEVVSDADARNEGEPVNIVREKELYVYYGFGNSDGLPLLYGITFYGDGVYSLKPSDFLEGDGTPSDYHGMPVTRVDAMITGSNLIMYAIPGTKGSVEFFPEDETEVPEPAACAYGALGLVSLLGMKRRIRK